MLFKVARRLLKSQKGFYGRSTNKRTFASCSKNDDCYCPPDTYDSEPEPFVQKTPVIEKDCKPCSFWDWKPKETNLTNMMKQQVEEKKKRKKRLLKDCYPEMVIEDKDCPGLRKRTPPKWSEVFPNNVCLCKCKTKVEEEMEKEAAKIEQQIKSKRKKREPPKISCPAPDWDHSGHLD